MDLLNTITFVIGVFLVLGLGAWAAVTSMSDSIEWNRRASRRRTVSAQPGQLTQVGSRS